MKLDRSKVKWQKGYDFMDDSPRYTFQGRDPQNTLAYIELVITQDKRRLDRWDTKKTTVYDVHIFYRPTETGDRIEGVRLLKDAKAQAIDLFEQYINKVAKQEHWQLDLPM